MTDKTQIDNIKAKVGKMLSLAGDQSATQCEIENALNMATSMMAKYNLTREDIDNSKENPIEKIQYGVRTAFTLSKKFYQWEGRLANFISKFVGTVDYYIDSAQHLNRKRGMVVTDEKGNLVYSKAVIFYGSDDDCEIAVELFDELKVAIQMAAIIRFGSWAKGDGGAYCEGFVIGLRNTHIREIEKLKMDTQTNALILVSEKNQLAIVEEATQWLSKEKNIKLSTRQGSTGAASGSHSARAEGKADGSSYGLNKPTATRKIA